MDRVRRVSSSNSSFSLFIFVYFTSGFYVLVVFTVLNISNVMFSWKLYFYYFIFYVYYVRLNVPQGVRVNCITTLSIWIFCILWCRVSVHVRLQLKWSKLKCSATCALTWVHQVWELSTKRLASCSAPPAAAATCKPQHSCQRGCGVKVCTISLGAWSSAIIPNVSSVPACSNWVCQTASPPGVALR